MIVRVTREQVEAARLLIKLRLSLGKDISEAYWRIAGARPLTSQRRGKPKRR